jgi:uncharacterized protein YuzE
VNRKERSALRVTYDAVADAAYVHLTAEDLSPGRDSVPVPIVDQANLPMVVLDFKDGRLVGIEVLGAQKGLPLDLLDASLR